jgi:hypothetical protein
LAVVTRTHCSGALRADESSGDTHYPVFLRSRSTFEQTGGEIPRANKIKSRKSMDIVSIIECDDVLFSSAFFSRGRNSRRFPRRKCRRAPGFFSQHKNGKVMREKRVNNMSESCA